MRWTPGGRSEDLEDRRGDSPGGGGGFGGFRIGLGGLVVLGILSFVFKVDLISPFLGGGGPGAMAPAGPPRPVDDAAEEKQVQFVSFVLDDAQQTWKRQMPQYQNAKLVLFRDAVESACGFAQSASGPFYCPGDQKVYIDLSFFDELRERFGAAGDFAQAYVLAHELGHHVQNLVGLDRQVRAAQQRDRGAANQLSVAMELQADCYAGVWGHSTGQRKILEQGDVEEGLQAAAAIGDDRIQRMAGRTVHPESFTHGSSAQRAAWFRKGLETGDPRACDPFKSGLDGR
jgi:hypothetical protein